MIRTMVRSPWPGQWLEALVGAQSLMFGSGSLFREAHLSGVSFLIRVNRNLDLGLRKGCLWSE